MGLRVGMSNHRAFCSGRGRCVRLLAERRGRHLGGNAFANLCIALRSCHIEPFGWAQDKLRRDASVEGRYLGDPLCNSLKRTEIEDRRLVF